MTCSSELALKLTHYANKKKTITLVPLQEGSRCRRKGKTDGEKREKDLIKLRNRFVETNILLSSNLNSVLEKCSCFLCTFTQS